MFSLIFRKQSKSENVKCFIDNIKFILNQQTINDLVESYTTRKLDQQRTFQMKILSLKIEKKKYLLQDLHLKNSHFNFMINDLTECFKSFSAVEINDFLSFYRKGLSNGVNFLTDEQRLSIFENLTQFQHNNMHHMRIRASILHSFSILGIENEMLYKNINRDSMNNLRSSDLLQIYKAMNFNKFYYNEEFARALEQKTQLIIGRLSDLDTFIQSFDQYLLLCELYNLKPASNVVKCYNDLFDHVFENNRYSLIKLFMCAKERVMPFLIRYHEEIKKLIKYPPRYYDKYLDLALIYSKIFPDDLESKRLLLKTLKEKLFLEPPSPSNFRMTIMELMTSTNYDDEFIAQSLQSFPNIKENYNCLLLTYSYYLTLTGKSIFENSMFNLHDFDINKVVDNVDLIKKIPILTYIHDHSEPFQDQSKSLISLIESNIISKAKNDPYLSTFILNTLKYNCAYSSHIANTQLLQNFQKSLILSNPPFK